MYTYNMYMYSAPRQESKYFDFELLCFYNEFYSILVDEIQNTLSTIVLEQVHEFMGYVRYSCHLYGFRSNSVL